MTSKNTTLEDISAVIGFTATLRLTAWFSNRPGQHKRNLWVPKHPEEGQMLVALLGMSAATALAKVWGGKWMVLPSIIQYDQERRRSWIAEEMARGVMASDMAKALGSTERRVQQICRELEVAGLVRIQGPKVPAKTPRKMPRKKPQEKRGVDFLKVWR